MTRAEILLYNVGRRLHTESVALINSGRGGDTPPSAVLTAEETAAAQRLGAAEALRLMRMGADGIAVPYRPGP